MVVTDVTDAFFAILVKAVDKVAEEYKKPLSLGLAIIMQKKKKKRSIHYYANVVAVLWYMQRHSVMKSYVNI
ncbi:GalR [Pasteurella multocida subsp. multocida str. Anand1_cattle]|nr:GalR [Pasteurella multocida subsp. multocida str. Anand1_cattle]